MMIRNSGSALSSRSQRDLRRLLQLGSPDSDHQGPRAEGTLRTCNR